MKYFLPILAFSFFFPVPLFAAVVSVGSTSSSVAPGSVVQITVTLESSEDINAIEGTLIVPAGFSVKEINDAGSVITLWIERPVEKEKKIRFAGVAPGGFIGKGILFQLFVKAETIGTTSWRIDGLRVLRHDGEGSQIASSVQTERITVSSSSALRSDAIEDREAPEPFSLVLAQDPHIFEGTWFISWSAQDKGSGVARFEVIETTDARREKGAWMPEEESWQPVESPYQLNDQERKSFVFVRAIDNKGNAHMAVLEPARTPFSLTDYLLMTVILIVFFTLLYYYRRYKTRLSV